jgi:hypothetical protein
VASAGLSDRDGQSAQRGGIAAEHAVERRDPTRRRRWLFASEECFPRRQAGDRDDTVDRSAFVMAVDDFN